MKARESCGCIHTGREWLTMCDAHKAEFEARHELAQAEHMMRQPEGTYLPEPVKP